MANKKEISRRQFLKMATLGASGLALASCTPSSPTTSTQEATSPIVTAPSATTVPDNSNRQQPEATKAAVATQQEVTAVPEKLKRIKPGVAYSKYDYSYDKDGNLEEITEEKVIKANESKLTENTQQIEYEENIQDAGVITEVFTQLPADWAIIQADVRGILATEGDKDPNSVSNYEMIAQSRLVSAMVTEVVSEVNEENQQTIENSVILTLKDEKGRMHDVLYQRNTRVDGEEVVNEAGFTPIMFRVEEKEENGNKYRILVSVARTPTDQVDENGNPITEDKELYRVTNIIDEENKITIPVAMDYSFGNNVVNKFNIGVEGVKKFFAQMVVDKTAVPEGPMLENLCTNIQDLFVDANGGIFFDGRKDVNPLFLRSEGDLEAFANTVAARFKDKAQKMPEIEVGFYSKTRFLGYFLGTDKRKPDALMVIPNDYGNKSKEKSSKYSVIFAYAVPEEDGGVWMFEMEGIYFKDNNLYEKYKKILEDGDMSSAVMFLGFLEKSKRTAESKALSFYMPLYRAEHIEKNGIVPSDPENSDELKELALNKLKSRELVYMSSN